MIKYIDCDGVILDTETGLFDEYHKLKEKTPELRKSIYLQEMDWEHWIQQAPVINEAIRILDNYCSSDVNIITKVHSLREAAVKIKYFRKHKVKNNIIIVPSDISKTQIVQSAGNVLVDDSEKNLIDWENNDGISICFGKNINRFQTVNSLDDVLNPNKLSLLLKK